MLIWLITILKILSTMLPCIGGSGVRRDSKDKSVHDDQSSRPW